MTHYLDNETGKLVKRDYIPFEQNRYIEIAPYVSRYHNWHYFGIDTFEFSGDDIARLRKAEL